MRSSSHLALASVWLAMIVSLPATSSAQTATGQITGTVRDSTGAVMSDVKVAVTNQQTGLTRQTTTGDNGDYVVPLLPVGVYVVTGEKAASSSPSTRTWRSTSIRSSASTSRSMPATSRRRWKCRRARRCSTPAAPRSGTPSPRSRSPSCRSTAGTSCSCCSSAPAPSRRPASRAACGRASATRSASWAPGRRRTTS